MELEGGAGDDRRFDGGGARLGDVGEAAALAGLLEIAQARGGPRLPIGPGDDACALTPPAGDWLLASQDCLVENVDFRRTWISPEQLGRRALQVAVSDLAGMGARPLLCLATLCAPAATEIGDVLAIQRGLAAAAAALDMSLGGGDLSDIDGPLVLDLTVIGAASPGRVLRRDAGRAGDRLLVTGILGRAAAGLQLLLGAGWAVEPSTAIADQWRAAQLEPSARIDEGRTLAAAGVICGGDISDGLYVDAGRTAKASGCAAELWAGSVPVDAELGVAAGDRWLDLVVGGGEDFELLVAVPEKNVAALVAGWPAGLAPLTVVGRLVEGTGVQLLDRESGAQLRPPAVSSRHWM